MQAREARQEDYGMLANWNRQLQENEGSEVMCLAAIQSRLAAWISVGYSAVIFEEQIVVGYALFRSADPEAEGSGVYLRQFYIDRAHRRKGYGTEAFKVLCSEVLCGQRIFLDALETNLTGHRFWESLGLARYSTRYEFNVESTG